MTQLLLLIPTSSCHFPYSQTIIMWSSKNFQIARMGSDMNIRKAENKDIGKIEELLEQVSEVHHEARPDLFKCSGTKYDETELELLIKDERRPIFVETDDNDEAVGYAMCVIISHSDDNVLTDIRTLYIDDLCVDEGHRGMHIGKDLYDHVLLFAREKGFYNVTLNVWNGNEHAITFYGKCGMKVQKYGMEVIL